MTRAKLIRSSTRVISLVLVITLVAGCAKVNTTGVRRYQGPRLNASRAIVVYDFEPTGQSIGLDSIDADGGDGLSNEDIEHRREVGRVLSDVLAKELEERGILSSRKAGPVSVPPGSMSIGGQIITVDEGSSAKRILIGFGSGKNRLSSAAQLYGIPKEDSTVLWEYQNTAASGPKPGILTTLPIGIAIQGVTLLLLVIQGGMATMGELSSSSTANAKRMAKELADSVEETLGRITRQN